MSYDDIDNEDYVVLWTIRFGMFICLLALIILIANMVYGSEQGCKYDAIYEVDGCSMYSNINCSEKRPLYVDTQVTWDDLKIGDTIAYENPYNSSEGIHHRIIYKDDLNIRTKGDANSHEDVMIHPWDNIYGRSCN